MWPFKRRKKALKNGYLNLVCTRCKSSMDTDLGHIQVYCPFCGEEMWVKAGDYRDLYEKFKKEK